MEDMTTTSSHLSTAMKITPSSGSADANHNAPTSQPTTVNSTISPAVTPVKTHPTVNRNTFVGTAAAAGGGGGVMMVPGSQMMDTPTPGTTTVVTDVAQLEDTPPPNASKTIKSEIPDDGSTTLEAAASILLGVQALERQQQQKQYELEALGVLALERQQAEVEARRKRSNSLSKSLTAPAFTSSSSSTPPNTDNNKMMPSATLPSTSNNISGGSSSRRRVDPIPPQVLAPSIGRGMQNPYTQPYPVPSSHPYPPHSVLVGHPTNVRDPTVTTAASGSEGEGSSSFGHGVGGGNEWYLYRENQDEDSEDHLKRSGSVSRFLVRVNSFFILNISLTFKWFYVHVFKSYYHSKNPRIGF